MNHLLILYNPYYQKDVIQQHLSVLQEKSQVGFGKIRSKLNDQEKRDSLEEIYKATNEKNFLQLFLTDYANLFAAKVIKVSKEIDEALIPSYYKEKNLEVEDFFIISDLRELVREDFSLLRDQFLANFIAPNNHTYAIYGNNYVYPLPVRLKEERSYFLGDEKHYLSVYKSKEYLTMQENFMRFVFGKRLFYLLHPDNINNIIHAELELLQSENDLLNDFTSIIVLLKHEKVQCHLEENLKRFINYPFSRSLSLIQNIRNKAVHAKAPGLNEVEKLRNEILGIEGASLLKGVLTHKETS
ncbi:ATP-binding protein [Helicobacter pylori]|nr:ATP-binding protein [Helicobacter pylori]